MNASDNFSQPGTSSPEELIQEYFVELLSTTLLSHHEIPEDPPTTETKYLAILNSLSAQLKPNIIHFMTDSTANKPFFQLIDTAAHSLPTVLEFIVQAASEITSNFYNNNNIDPSKTTLENKIQIQDVIRGAHTHCIQHTKLNPTDAPLSKALSVSTHHTHLKLRAFFTQLVVDTYYQAYENQIEDDASRLFVTRAKKHCFRKLNQAHTSLLQQEMQNTKLPMLVQRIGNHHPRCVFNHLTEIGIKCIQTHEYLFAPLDQNNPIPAPKTREYAHFIENWIQKHYDEEFAHTPFLDHACENITLSQLKCYAVSDCANEETGEILALNHGNS